MQTGPWLKLKPREIDKVFTQVANDLHRIVMLDGIDMLKTGFRIRCSDAYGPLPVIDMEDSLDRYSVLNKLQQQASQLCAIVKMRENLFGIFRGCKFLLPTRTEEGYLVGLRFMEKTVLSEDRTHWEAYHRLEDEAVSRIL